LDDVPAQEVSSVESLDGPASSGRAEDHVCRNPAKCPGLPENVPVDDLISSTAPTEITHECGRARRSVAAGFARIPTQVVAHFGILANPAAMMNNPG
jgi:hypothetical protein